PMGAWPLSPDTSPYAVPLWRVQQCSCTVSFVFFIAVPRPPTATLFPYTTLFRSIEKKHEKGLLSRVLYAIGKSLGWTDDQVEKRSEEHTSELQSRENLVCRLLLEKKKLTTGQKDADASPPARRSALPDLTPLDSV